MYDYKIKALVGFKCITDCPPEIMIARVKWHFLQ